MKRQLIRATRRNQDSQGKKGSNVTSDSPTDASATPEEHSDVSHADTQRAHAEKQAPYVVSKPMLEPADMQSKVAFGCSSKQCTAEINTCNCHDFHREPCAPTLLTSLRQAERHLADPVHVKVSQAKGIDSAAAAATAAAAAAKAAAAAVVAMQKRHSA